MKQIFALALSLTTAISLASSPALAGPYNGDVPPDSYRTPWISKVQELSPPGRCATGHAISSIAFFHQAGQNETYQESFQLRCTRMDLINEASCGWVPFISNFETSSHVVGATLEPNLATQVATAIQFYHPFGQNETFQQSYSVRLCDLKPPFTELPEAGDPAEYQTGSKVELATEFSCNGNPGSFGEPYIGFLRELGFSHPFGHNGTHEESVYVKCAKP